MLFCITLVSKEYRDIYLKSCINCIEQITPPPHPEKKYSLSLFNMSFIDHLYLSLSEWLQFAVTELFVFS